RTALTGAEGGAEAQARALEELAVLVEAVDAAAPEPGEEQALVGERERLRHLDELVVSAAGAAERLNPAEGAGAITLAGEAQGLVAGAAARDPALAELASELDDSVERLREAGVGLRGYVEGLEAAPERLEQVEQRLQLFADLRRRFGADSIEALAARAGEA